MLKSFVDWINTILAVCVSNVLTPLQSYLYIFTTINTIIAFIVCRISVTNHTFSFRSTLTYTYDKK